MSPQSGKVIHYIIPYIHYMLTQLSTKIPELKPNSTENLWREEKNVVFDWNTHSKFENSLKILKTQIFGVVVLTTNMTLLPLYNVVFAII